MLFMCAYNFFRSPLDRNEKSQFVNNLTLFIDRLLSIVDEDLSIGYNKQKDIMEQVEGTCTYCVVFEFVSQLGLHVYCLYYMCMYLFISYVLLRRFVIFMFTAMIEVHLNSLDYLRRLLKKSPTAKVSMYKPATTHLIISIHQLYHHYHIAEGHYSSLQVFLIMIHTGSSGQASINTR